MRLYHCQPQAGVRLYLVVSLYESLGRSPLLLFFLPPRIPTHKTNVLSPRRSVCFAHHLTLERSFTIFALVSGVDRTWKAHSGVGKRRQNCAR